MTDVWMFRDPLDMEKHMMMARRKQLAAAEEGRQMQRQKRDIGKRVGGGDPGTSTGIGRK